MPLALSYRRAALHAQHNYYMGVMARWREAIKFPLLWVRNGVGSDADRAEIERARAAVAECLKHCRRVRAELAGLDYRAMRDGG